MSHLHGSSLLARSGCRARPRTLIAVSAMCGGNPVMKGRDMRLRRHGVVAIAVLGLMATAVVPASAERGGGGLGGAAKAGAFALDVDVDVLNALPLGVRPPGTPR